MKFNDKHFSSSLSLPLSISPSHNSSRLLAVAVFQCSNRTSSDHLNVGVAARSFTCARHYLSLSCSRVSSAKWRRSGSTVVTQRWRSVNRRPAPPPLLFFPWPAWFDKHYRRLLTPCTPIARDTHVLSLSISLCLSSASESACVSVGPCVWHLRSPLNVAGSYVRLLAPWRTAAIDSVVGKIPARTSH